MGRRKTAEKRAQVQAPYATRFEERAIRSSPTTIVAEGGSASVSVLVTARNYGRFLAPCLHSVLSQTVRPVEIIYADDGSDDDSLRVAGRFASEGVRILPLEHRGVVSARNRAVQASTGDFLLHVDADNLLSPDFIERQFEAVADGAAFSYASKQHFGHRAGRWQPPEWDRDQLWLDNYVDTSALVRRELFEAAGGWRDSLAGTLWDWDLWLRVSRYGEGARADANLYYRDHDDNWSSLRGQSVRNEFGLLKGHVRRSAARMTICSVFSGRLAHLFPQWIAALVEALKPGEREKPELFIIDDSPQGFWSVAGDSLGNYADCFRAVRVDRVAGKTSWADRRPDRTATARFLATIYNRFLSETSSEVLWFVEDDIVVPAESGSKLLHMLLDGDEPKAAVSGLYKSRHEDCFVASNLINGKVLHTTRRPHETLPCDLAGTGCLMVFRPLAHASFAPFWPVPNTAESVPAHDWVYTWRLSQCGQPVWINPDVLCRHYVSEREWV